MMRLCSPTTFFTSFTASFSTSLDLARALANWVNSSATMVLSMMLGQAMEMAEPRERNSNLLPVKAKGEVRLRSVLSRWSSGICAMPTE